MQLTRVHIPADSQDDEYVGWAAEWGLRDDLVGTEDSNDDLRQLVADIIDDVRHQWPDQYDLTIEWELSGEAPFGKTVQEIVTEAGVILPTTITAD